MSPTGMGQQSEEQRRAFEREAVRIVEAADEMGLPLRLLGSLAFHLHCQKYGRLQQQLGRAYTDIDFAGYRSLAAQTGSFLTSLGYHEEAELNILFAGERLIYDHPTNGLHVDVFFDKLNFCHEVSWLKRLEVDKPTIPLAELLLEKMQIVKINEKDVIDTIMLLLEHPLGSEDRETINIALIANLCSQNWGLWRTITMNLDKVSQLGQHYEELSRKEKSHLAEQVKTALEAIEAEPKTIAWKLRSRIGDRVKWYQEVDDVS